MESLLDDILKTVKFKSAVYFKHGFCSPWGMDVSQGDFAQFHLVTSGNCMLIVDEQKMNLEKGDIVILPNGFPHQIKDASQSFCRPGVEVVNEVINGTQPFPGEKPDTFLICGHYELDRELSHPIFEKLPEYLVIKNYEYRRFDLIYSIFELIQDEMTTHQQGYKTVSLRLAEILFISIIRHYYLHQVEEKLNLFKDELIYQAVGLIHKNLDRSWKIESLAHQVGISRTLFIERFKHALGETPGKYITNWRMTKAKYFLKNTDLPITQIGEKIGYHSETSFSRVFKQQYNITPGKYRRMN